MIATMHDTQTTYENLIAAAITPHVDIAWIVRDVQTGRSHGTALYVRLRDANAKAERLNQKYGAVRYVALSVWAN